MLKSSLYAERMGQKDSSCILITGVIKLICDGSQVLSLHMGT